MKIEAELLSYKKDGRIVCHPSIGYPQEASIALDDYDEVSAIEGELPPSDETFPKGAAVLQYVKVGKKLLKRKSG